MQRADLKDFILSKHNNITNKMKFVLFALFLVLSTIEAMKNDVKPEPTNQCVTEINSFRTLLDLTSQLVKLQQANCNKGQSVTSGGIQRKENKTALATKEDIKDLKNELRSMHALLQNCKGHRNLGHTFYPKDCQDLLLRGYKKSKVYTIYPKKGSKFQVFCDQEKDGGGWTVLQRRQDGSEHFFRTWNDYKTGFGNLTDEFWLGNAKIHTITESGNYKLRIDMTDFSKNSRHASYKTFQVGTEKSGYVLKVSGYSGNAGDSLSYHSNAKFVTKDRNDRHGCAKKYKGGWWYQSCHYSNLNGRYLKGKHKSYADGVDWYHWKGYHYSLKFAEIKTRKANV